MKTIDEYLDLPYAFVVTRDVDEEGRAGWVAEVEELPGCISQGGTPDEALENVRDAMRAWISVALDDGVEVSEPRAAADYSGRFLVRVPASPHADLARRASHEGVSLNQFVTGALAGAVGWRGGSPRGRRRPVRRRSAKSVGTSP
jgi:predicted RNase H-like HicB family nuclease